MDQQHVAPTSRPAASQERQRAQETVAAAWRAAGWPHRPCSTPHYERIHHCLCQYLHASFPGQFSAADVAKFAQETLLAFMAPLHAGRLVNTERSHERLLEELLDRALDEPLRCVPSPPSSARSAQGIASHTVAQDEQLTGNLFGAEASEVRAALGELIENGLAVQCRIITYYLNASQRRPDWEPRPSEAAAEINNHHPFRSGPLITAQIVTATLENFRKRLNRAVR